ncbi:urease accessory protein UreD [Luteolibacter luteus]|uniref:Urease accessory protein UreD n=1 Tax=Luteolibacter luteus TaxID=2728835 RepID=A0A858RHU6_9BACT|nr:urease accessory protein UreD [Luteolibacter luteus]QJE96285.1 urease accessory protein UreD [Luteolibacter luteus]
MEPISQIQGITGRTIRGHLDLRCDLRPDGVTYLSRQSFRAPIHLSKPHVESGALVVHLVNPTAGFFDGDRLDVRVDAGQGSRVVLSSPGASRVHRARGETPAICSQHLTVESGAFMEWIPEPFIPQAGARYHQQTKIELAEDAGLFFFEWIAPGRVARGEIFDYESLRWELDLEVGGKLIARERYNLNPSDHSLTAMREKFPAAHYVTVHVAGITASAWPAEELDALSGEKIYLGHGPLLAGAFMVRALCADSLAARSLLVDLRQILYRASGHSAPRLGRLNL